MRYPLLAVLLAAWATPASALGVVKTQLRVAPVARGFLHQGASMPSILRSGFRLAGTPTGVLPTLTPSLQTQALGLSVAAAQGAVVLEAVRAEGVGSRLTGLAFALNEAGQSLQNKDSSGIHGAGRKLEAALTGALNVERSDEVSYRPALEWWRVSGRTSDDSTAALLKSDVTKDGPVAAVYHYQASKTYVGTRKLVKSLFLSALAGFAALGFLGGALSTFAEFGAAVTFQHVDGIPDPLQTAAFFGIVGAVIGAAVGAARHVAELWKGEHHAPIMKAHTGTLELREGALVFNTGSAVVDLAGHADAEVLDRREVATRWYDPIIGGGIVPILALSFLLPAFAWVVPLLVGSALGSALAAGTNTSSVLASALGGTLGLAAAWALWGGISGVGWAPMAILIILSSALGALQASDVIGRRIRSGIDLAKRRLAARPWWAS